MIGKAAKIVRESGATGLIRRAVAFVYRRGIRPLLPSTGPVRYGGVAIGDHHKWGDRWVPPLWVPPRVEDVPDYEAALLSGLKEHVRSGDRVVVIGGGIGVTATMAALQAGPTGHVHCFEGAREAVEHVRRTAVANGQLDRLTIHHAVVARAISVYGTESTLPIVAPAELPACDVLELDCEGAEMDILAQMTIQPRIVLVETHGLYGAKTALVTQLLEERGYSVQDYGVAEPGLRERCERDDIRVLVGTLP